MRNRGGGSEALRGNHRISSQEHYSERADWRAFLDRSSSSSSVGKPIGALIILCLYVAAPRLHHTFQFDIQR